MRHRNTPILARVHMQRGSLPFGKAVEKPMSSREKQKMLPCPRRLGTQGLLPLAQPVPCSLFVVSARLLIASSDCSPNLPQDLLNPVLTV